VSLPAKNGLQTDLGVLVPGRIVISSLRNIKRLEFDIPDRGVWVLTANNGGGKSSLLACLRRIGYRLSFPVHFPASQRSDRLDNFANASVQYELNGESVTYTYSGVRWVPIPKRNSYLFENFGYSDVLYIGATAERITPRPGDFDPSRVTRAAPYLIENANRIFDTERFSDLRRVNLTRGQWNRAFVMAHNNNPRTYHSEAHFSMGELCVLNLLEQVSECRNNSLVLIDELELAIHPRAQRILLNHLVSEAERKNLTVIFSTHSVTILKSINRKNIICLNNEDGVIKPIYGCFPTYALGYLASDEEKSVDALIYVEDEAAFKIADPCLKLAISRKYNNQEVFPSFRVLPVGSFKSTINFLKSQQFLMADHIKQFALLDEDVKTETLRGWQASGNAQGLAEYNQIEGKIKFLPWVPEVVACKELYENSKHYRDFLRRKFASNHIAVNRQDFEFVERLQGVVLRNEAKAAWRNFVRVIAQDAGKMPDEVGYLEEPAGSGLTPVRRG
jgi:predicted ATPase